MPIYKYSQLSGEMDYDTSSKAHKEMAPKGRESCILYFGQLKLLFSELLFLAKHAKEGDVIIYIGAAPGYHINKLVEMFPKCHFELWDPRASQVKPTNNVKIYQEKFTDTTAKQYVNTGKEYLLLCDIRNLEIGEHKSNIKEMDKIVMEDMSLQKEWCRMINPRKAYLKFRVPYGIKTIEYLSGTLYLQPFAPLSTETRLSTSDYDTLVTYDAVKIDRRMAYHNIKNRCHSINSPAWCQLIKERRLLPLWDVIFALYICQMYVTRIRGDTKKTRKKSMKLFIDIIEYHRNKYGNKYDLIFND